MARSARWAVLLALVAVFGVLAALGAVRWAREPRDAREQPGGEGCAEGERPLMVYFLRDTGTDLEPVPVARCAAWNGTDPEAGARAAVAALVQGPTEEERRQRLASSIPSGTRLLGARWQRPYLHVDFGPELEQVGGSAAVQGLLDQLAWTLTEMEGVGAVILEIEGEQVGTADRPFTGQGFLFRALRRPLGPWQARLGPAQALDVFIASVGDRERMWALMGPSARRQFGSPEGIEVEAFSEGLGAWRAYRVVEERVDGDRATVTIGGRQHLEGVEYPDARYTARMVREQGVWKWDGTESTGY